MSVARVRNPRVELWAHLVSQHAAIVPLDETYAALKDLHEHEHKGPGTIRNHPEGSRAYAFQALGKVLAEDEYTLIEPPPRRLKARRKG